MNLQDDLKQVFKDTVFQEKARTETLIFKERTQSSLFFGDDKDDVSLWDCKITLIIFMKS